MNGGFMASCTCARGRLSYHVTSVCALLWGAPAFSQDSAEAFDEPFDLGNIIVEGTKADLTLKDTPGSVAVITSETLDELGIQDLDQAFGLIGNVRKFEANRGENGFVIRGLNSEGVTESFNNAPLTSVIIDGAIQSREATRRGARGLWDVEQVEIHRGPQSTLQGRGALAGAVIIKTKDPTFVWEGAARGTIGEFGRRDGAFALSGPIVEDTLAFRISGQSRFSEGSITFNDPANDVIGEDEFQQLRAKLLYTPPTVPGLRFQLTLSNTRDKPGVNAVNSPNFFDRLFLTGAASAVEIREAENTNAVFEASYEFDNGNRLEAISAWIDSNTDISTPAGSSFSRIEDRGGEDFTQDIRYTFGDPRDTFSGVLGLFYGNFTLPRTSLVTSGPFVVQRLISDDSNENFSAYADLRLRFSDTFSLLAGGRYTHETVTEFSVGESFGQPINIANSETFDVFLPKFGLFFDLNELETLSLLYSKGYRSGFSEVVAGTVNRIEPEFLDSFELSYKAVSANNRWSFASTLFYSEYTNQQIVLPLPIPQTVSAGKSELYGLELEGNYRFDNGLSLFASVGLLETEFTEFATSTGDFTGNELPEAPAVTLGLGANYRAPSGFFASATASYTDSYFSAGSIENDPALRVPSFTNVDVALGYEWENFRARLFVDNVFDEDYVTSLFNTSVGQPPVEATVNDPRTVGFEVSYTF